MRDKSRTLEIDLRRLNMRCRPITSGRKKMARDDKGSSDKGKVRVRVIDFEMEGSNQTLRESIKEIVGAVGKGTVQVVRLPAALPSGKNRGANSGDSADEEVDLGVADEEDEGADQDESQQESRPRKPRRVKALKIVQVDLVGGEMPLKTFLASAPDALEKRYILIAYWFKKYRDIAVVNPEHIYTAYMAMNWTTMPRDPAKPFRNAKEDGAFEKAEGESAFAITHIGEMKAVDILNKNKSGE
jgi:hypothetical protein